jgi:outer membrane immunogenic protein
MYRFLLLVVWCAFLVSSGIGIGSAADLPEYSPPPPAVSAMPQFSWSGFYIGGNAGYGWSTASGTVTTTTGSGPFTASGSGFLGGAEAGYNWHYGPAVFGMEADFQGTTESGPFNAVAGPTISGTEKTPWFGTVRGRLGFAYDRILLYATGGGVYGESTLSGTVSTVGPFSSSTQFWSWTAGGGIEAAFWGCWSAKLEYLFIASPNRLPAVPTVTAITDSASANLVRVGLNYHF